MLVLVGAIGAGLFLVARRMALRDGRSYFSTKRLFRELCQLHELDWPSRRLLWRLARAHDSEASRSPVPGADLVYRRTPRFLAPTREIKQRLFESQRGRHLASGGSYNRERRRHPHLGSLRRGTREAPRAPRPVEYALSVTGTFASAFSSSAFGSRRPSPLYPVPSVMVEMSVRQPISCQEFVRADPVDTDFNRG